MSPDESAPPPLDADAVRHVAKLSRLALDKTEIAAMCDELSAILDHIDCIRALDTDGVDPLDHPTELVDRLRDDASGEVLETKSVLANAATTEGPYLSVPKVLGGEEG